MVGARDYLAAVPGREVGGGRRSGCLAPTECRNSHAESPAVGDGRPVLSPAACVIDESVGR
jgi:hypothetical protein